MVRKYQRKVKAEYLARQKLINAGYSVLRNSDPQGPFDLIAWDSDRLYFIQCWWTDILEITGKAVNSWFEKVIEQMRAIERPKGATTQLWIYTPGVGFRSFDVLKNGIVPV